MRRLVKSVLLAAAILVTGSCLSLIWLWGVLGTLVLVGVPKVAPAHSRARPSIPAWLPWSRLNALRAPDDPLR